MKSFEELIETLRGTQPSWQNDGNGVRGIAQISTTESNNQQQQTPFSFQKIASTEKMLPMEESKTELPTSVFIVCVSGQPHIATLYGTVVPMEE